MEDKKHYRDLFQKWKCCIIIPTYNNSGTILDVINGVSDFTHQLIVVNDGSTDKTGNLLKEYLENQVDIIDYRSNRGKGFALKQGFKRAIDLGYEYAITIDSDGQHMPSDLPRFIDRLEHASDSIIVGERKMPEENVPAKNTFANKFSNFWFRL
ncbi:MAG: glycosyltransferase family 2 protein, partial [Bacteroidales bacterium]